MFDWNFFDWDIEYIAVEFFACFFVYLLLADMESRSKSEEALNQIQNWTYTC